MVKRALFLTLVVALLGYVTPAAAGELYLNAAGAVSLNGANCTPVVNTHLQSTGGGGPAFVTRDCDTTTEEGFGWYFFYPADAPNTATSDQFSALLYVLNSAATAGNYHVAVEMGCSPNGLGINSYIWGSAPTVQTFAAPTSTTEVKVQTLASQIGVGATGNLNQLCAVVVRRLATNGADTQDGDMRVLGLRLNYD